IDVGSMLLGGPSSTPIGGPGSTPIYILPKATENLSAAVMHISDARRLAVAQSDLKTPFLLRMS
ncbi:hypothetical protein, partial [Sphingomonas glacialis]|uniref:hypothetical protein n=1 Tax=Sphingomonas glacialis TaxID=658225 RepID=UPI001E2E7023